MLELGSGSWGRGGRLSKCEGPRGRRGTVSSRTRAEADVAAAESKGQCGGSEAGDMGRAWLSSLMGHRQGFGVFPGKNSKPLRAIKWKAEGPVTAGGEWMQRTRSGN